MIKDIIASLAVGRPRDVSGEFAVSVAAAFDAHLSGVATAYEPVIGGMPFPVADVGLVERVWTENRKAADRAKTQFDEAARKASLSADSVVIDASAPEAARRFAELARECDLAILPQSQPDDDIAETLMIESALFGSGRPVLVVPYIQSSGLKLDRVMVCWDGSRNASRAVADAMPLLRRAGAVDIITIENRERRNELTGARIAEHLARHGVNVGVKPIVAKDVGIADTILSHAADTSADLIVMGGYGHSRLREFVLGGATQGMLAAMTVPTLMAH